MSEGLTVGIVGNGGRESAMAAMSDMSEQVGEVVGIGLNAGVDKLHKGRSVDVAPDDIDGIVREVRDSGIDVVFVGPELPLDLGLVNALEDWSEATCTELAVLGPRRNAAIEGSKVLQRMLWDQLGLNGKTWYQVFSARSDQGLEEEILFACDYTKARGATKSVIKPDGFTKGAGVTLPKTQEEAERTIIGMLSGQLYPGSAEMIIIERRGTGPEVSATSISDGNGGRLELPLTQDHKLRFDPEDDVDKNPNSGGMGSNTSVPYSLATEDHRREISRGIGLTQEIMAEQGRPFKGIWYEAEMLEGEDVLRLEVNNRGGNSETQSLIWAMIHSGIDIFEIYLSAARGKLGLRQSDVPQNLGFSAVTLTFAAEGYATGDVTTGDEVHGIDNEYDDKIHIDLGGVVKRDDGKYYSNGGRVLFVTGVGKTVREAADLAYSTAGEGGINFRGMAVRRTIAQQSMGETFSLAGRRLVDYREVL